MRASRTYADMDHFRCMSESPSDQLFAEKGLYGQGWENVEVQILGDPLVGTRVQGAIIFLEGRRGTRSLPVAYDVTLNLTNCTYAQMAPYIISRNLAQILLAASEDGACLEISCKACVPRDQPPYTG